MNMRNALPGRIQVYKTSTVDDGNQTEDLNRRERLNSQVSDPSMVERVAPTRSATYLNNCNV